jgi:hypothetical protein
VTAIHVSVTAEDIEAARPRVAFKAWAAPVEDALARLSGQAVDISGDTDEGNLAAIGQGSWTLVIELPTPANRWLNRRWRESIDGSEPFAFDIEIPDWVLSLVGA